MGNGHDSALATEQYEFVRAPRPLGGLVASAVGYAVQRAAPHSGTPPGTGTRLHRGLPSPYLTLIFSLDEPIVAGEDEAHALGTDAYHGDIVLGGLQQRPAFVRQPAREAGVQLAVHPLAARALTGMPASELTQLAGDGTDILGAAAAEVRERMCEQNTWETRFATLAAYLQRRADAHADKRTDGRANGRRAPVRPEVAEAWRWLAWHRGAGSLDGMVRHVALSPRQLTTVFRREVGLSPKQVGGLMRFDRARQDITRAVAGETPLDLAEIAAHNGFYDHSHLVRDFRRYTGLAPTTWIAEELRNIQAGGHSNGEE